VLQGVEAQIGQMRSLGMVENPEDPAFLLGSVNILHE
jgi:hypothetical protein